MGVADSWDSLADVQEQVLRRRNMGHDRRVGRVHVKVPYRSMATHSRRLLVRTHTHEIRLYRDYRRCRLSL